MSSTEKAKYDNMALKHKQKLRNNEKKFTSNGIPISIIENAEKELQEYKELERTDIKNMVNSRVVTNSEFVTVITIISYL